MQIIQSDSNKTIRSLICDQNGIIIAETVYRCLFCASIFNSLDLVHIHYYHDHLVEQNIEFTPNDEFEEEKSIEPIDYDNDDYDPIEEEPDEIDNFSINNQPNEDSISHHSSDNHDIDQGKFVSKMEFVLDCFVWKLIRKLGFYSVSPESKSSIQSQPGRKTVTCEVCGMTKFYSHISRRYGVFSCESCAKFFYRYTQKPQNYTCPNGGNCSLQIESPGSRCKACLLDACLGKYILDPKKHPKVFKKHFTRPSTNSVDMVIESVVNGHFNESDIKESRGLESPPLQLNFDQYLTDEIRNPKKMKTLTTKAKRGVEDFMKTQKSRRMPCRSCEGCQSDDCGDCLYCLDKPKFGGSDVKKQKCMKRKCLRLK